TPGRGDEMEEFEEDTPQTATVGAGAAAAAVSSAPRTAVAKSANDRSDFRRQAEIILRGLGGADNIQYVEPCATRLRVEVNDMDKVDERKIKSAGVPGTNKTGP